VTLDPVPRRHQYVIRVSAGRFRGGRRPGTRIKVTVEKENLIRRLHAEDEKVTTIARLVEVSRKTVYQVLGK
jgi:DNA invertase Pin-like site-specific DNA recombinase